ncbi:hypothetical protein PHJA_000861800 [Phtheirospermum japonicum]|uniref:Uncharacterized protein n=1 Tax=Phtheirospermum japonicum TaxID=374723 RepID=A0A830BYS3_9LAMI|nr:hypothetical protein PHJA_000861800 [Phtheirospermum japonicum]
MGCCFSSDSDHSLRQKPTADVISLNGELRRYPLPVAASQVLQFEALSPDSFFVCNSDRLFFDDYVPRLEPEDELEPAEIYFVLPVSKLQHRLAASDMAALAVKASVAINASNPRRSRKARISPVSDSQSSQHHSPSNSRKASKGSARPELGITRSGSVRKLQRYSSRRAKSAVRSFRMKLTTINEGSVLLLN